MRIRSVIVAVAAVATLAACSSSKSSNNPQGIGGQSSTTSSSAASSSAGGSGSGAGANAAVCARYTDATKQLNDSLSAIGNPQTAKDAIDRTISVLNTIGTDAPANVKTAVNDLIDAFKTAQSAFGGGTPDPSKLQGLSTRIPADAQVLATYIAQNCAGLHS